MNSYWSAISLAIALAYPISPLAISQFVHQADAPINNNSSRKTERSFRPKTLTSKVLYGSSPETIEDLRHLKSLGIKTIINVDGQTPRTDLTRGLAITYLHLPIGYGRIDVRRAKDLAKATHASSGKVYIHCNLGKHRAPAAAIVACVGDGSIENRQVEQLLRQIFPNQAYKRLKQSAEQAKRFHISTLANHDTQFNTQATITATQRHMLDLSRATKRLFPFIDSTTVAKRTELPELVAETFVISETFRELTRLDSSVASQEPLVPSADPDQKTPKINNSYATLLSKSLNTARLLHGRLKLVSGESTTGKSMDSVVPLLKDLKSQCVNCHNTYR